MAGVDILASAFSGANTAFLAEQYARWAADPGSADPTFAELFGALNEDARAVLEEATGASWAPHHPAFQPAAAAETARPAPLAVSAEQIRAATIASLRALMLIRSYRVRGHLEARLDPLGLQIPKPHPELDPRSYGFTDADLDRTFYETDSPVVLRSPAYLARLAQPTEWTRRVMPQFRAMSRTACLVAGDAGGGIGGIVALVGSDAAPGAAVSAAVAAAVAQPAVTRARVWCADANASVANPEAALRPGGDASFATVVLVEGTEAEPVGAAAAALARQLGLAGSPTLYVLLFAAPASPPAAPGGSA